MKTYLKNKVKKVLYRYGAQQVKKHGFWFVDIPRTSSTAIHAELGKNFGIAYGKRNVIEKNHRTFQIFSDHNPAMKMRELLGPEIWGELFTFTMVRNPWDRAYSMYNYRLRKEKSIPENLSFEDYIFALEQRDPTLFSYRGHYYSASDYLLDKEGRFLVSYVAKYENRKRDLSHIAKQIGITKLGSLRVQQAALKGESYRVAYDEKTAEIIEKIYAKDVELFDYQF